MLKAVARRVLRDEIKVIADEAWEAGNDIGFVAARGEAVTQITNARNQAYENGLSRGQEGNAHSYAQGYQQGCDDQSKSYNESYNEGWEAGFQSGDGASYEKGYDEGFEAGKPESAVPEDEASSLEDCCESLEDEGFNEYDSGYGFGYHAGYEAAKYFDKALIDHAYALGVNDVAVTLRKALGAHTFTLITHLLERSARG